MNGSSGLRRLLALSVAVMLACAGVASAMTPSALPSFANTALATGSLNQTRPETDANYVTYQHNNPLIIGAHSDVVLHDLATDTDVTIGGGDSFDQTNPDVSQGRVVYEDNTAGNGDIRMYDAWIESDIALTTSADDEVMPRISGNLVAWYDQDTDRIWYRDIARGVIAQVPDSSNVVYLDVDRGRIFWTDSLITQNCYVFEPGRDTTSLRIWEQLNNEDILSLRAYGDYAAMTLKDALGVSVHRVSTTGSYSAGLQDGTSNPSVFHDAIAYELEGSGGQDMWWRLAPKNAPFASISVASNAADETHPSMFGNRIAYQRLATLLNNDIYLASDSSEVTRTQGADRYLTAVETSQRYFHSADAAILCTGLNFPDALSAGPFAKLLNAPLLLTRPSVVSDETMAELERLGVSKVYLIGGADVVNESVKAQLEAEGMVTSRIEGADRYATSVALATVMADELGGAWSVDHAFFARGDNFPDALAVGPVAAGALSPIILVKPTEIPAVVADAVDTLNITSGVVVGGPDVVTGTVYDGLEAIMQGNGGDQYPMERWYGADRYATAIDVIEHGVEIRWIDLDTVGVATGANFPDALGGGAALGRYGSPVMLAKNPLPTSVTAWLDANAMAIGRVDVFGGSDVVPDAVRDAIAAKLE